ncbi:MAG: hypothetical protein ACE5G9_10805 [Nitrospinales bacterium]
MLGAVEILMIAVIFGIIYGRDAIDKTWRKHPDEGLGESLAGDLKEYYEKDPKRLIRIVVGFVSIVVFLGLVIYWVFTRTEIPKMLGKMMGFD